MSYRSEWSIVNIAYWPLAIHIELNSIYQLFINFYQSGNAAFCGLSSLSIMDMPHEEKCARF